MPIKPVRRSRNVKTRVAQIGVGYWGPNLLRALTDNPRCEVAVVVDPEPSRRDYIQSLYPNLPVYAAADRIFADPSIEAVVIATPIETHYGLAMKALRSGKHILVEKPLAAGVAEAFRIGTLARKKSLVAMSGHTFLFNDAVRELKRIIDSGAIGDLRYVYSQRLNLGRIRSDVDALWNFAPHDVSIIQYLLDGAEPVRISRRGMDYVQPGIQDVVFMDLVYPNKVMAHIHVSWLDPKKVRQMTVVGTKKMVVYDDMAEKKIAVFDKGIDRKAVLGQNMDYDFSNRAAFTHRSGAVEYPEFEFREPLVNEIDHFLDCVRDRMPCLTDPEHALQVIRILSGKTLKKTVKRTADAVSSAV